MAIDPKLLQKLISRPEAFNADDMEEEDIQDALKQKIQGSDQEPQAMPMEDETEEAAPEMGEQAEPAQSYQPSPEVMDLMKKLKSPSPEGADVQAEDISGDMDAPMELRKKAIERIKQKYLGQ